MTTTTKHEKLHLICAARKKGGVARCAAKLIRYETVLAKLLERGPVICSERPRGGPATRRDGKLTGPQVDARLREIEAARDGIAEARENLVGRAAPLPEALGLARELQSLIREARKLEHNRSYWDRAGGHLARDLGTNREYYQRTSRGATQITKDTEGLLRLLLGRGRKDPARLGAWLRLVFRAVVFDSETGEMRLYWTRGRKEAARIMFAWPTDEAAWARSTEDIF